MPKIVFVMFLFWVLKTTAAPLIIPSAPQLAVEGYILIDSTTGKILAEHNSQVRLPPASLTKIMTSYVIASEIKQGRIKLSDSVPVSVKAWRMEGSRMFIQEGTSISVEDLLRGIIIQSGNDASVAMAEFVAGSEETFSELMNAQAAVIGMPNSQFRNATGLPDEAHYTTAADLARLTSALIEGYPEHYKLYREKYFTYNDIRQANRNSLLFRNENVDGVKTGYTKAAGYCLVASSEQNGTRLISVVMGADSERNRASETQKLLTYGFRFFETVDLYRAGDRLRKVKVWGGLHESIQLGVEDNLALTIPRGQRDQLTARIQVDPVIKAPLTKGQALGTLTLMLDGEILVERPVLALNAVAEAGFLGRIWDEVRLFFTELISGDTSAV
ncbi:MAG: D-alanyl-D-alanine carboxypeptidase [Gammaproteobacteria bacterium]|nr:D-alanyl-D-alanine carboxypeptidase [Gammaproteobacteria bacterium]